MICEILDLIKAQSITTFSELVDFVRGGNIDLFKIVVDNASFFESYLKSATKEQIINDWFIECYTKLKT